MSDEVLNENLEEIIETPVEETTEEPIVDETMDDELIDEKMIVPEETLPEIELPPQRVNYFCVIAKEPWENGGRDLQTNSSWSSNPNPDVYAVVPDDMVPAIQETNGFCDIVLNEDGTEVVSFTPLKIPEFPVPEPEPTAEQKRVAELEREVAMLTECCADILYMSSLAEMQAAESEVTE